MYDFRKMVEDAKVAVQRRLDHAQGRLPVFECAGCGNAINSRTCPVCQNRLTQEDWQLLHASLLK